MQVHQWTATDARATLPIYARSLRYSDSDYDVIRMVDLAYQTPPPCITSKLYGLFAHRLVARDDRMPCEKHVIDSESLKSGSSRVTV